ncbi:citryl-CoA lyase [bacterium]|nr:citryl-CoA lyase [bacterium]
MVSWETKITSIKPNEILFRGYPVEQVMEQLSYAETVYLMLKGELPTEDEGKVFQSILVCSMDHGVTPPSAMGTLNSTSTGAPVNAALASGLLAINDFHGGAIGNAMKLFKEAGEAAGRPLDRQKLKAFMEEKFANKVRFSGFGHRIHSTDPRSVALVNIARKNLTADALYWVDIAITIEELINEIKGKRLPVNVDGMIGAVLLSLNFDIAISNAIFMISRLPGLLSHFVEEKNTQKPMRTIVQSEAIYSGSEKRDLPKRGEK